MLRNFLVALILLHCVGAAADEQKREFLSGYIGTVPSAKGDLAKTFFARPEVRRLLAALEKEPLSVEKATQMLSGTATRLFDLKRLRLISTNNGAVRIGFPYFTAQDIRNIHAVTAKYVPDLVAAIAARKTELYSILSSYPLTSVPRKRLMFVVLAGFSLNWDALKLLEQHHWREPLLIRGPGWQYGFWASEAVPDYSYKGYFWGSSTFPADSENVVPPLDFAFSSFGDP